MVELYSEVMTLNDEKSHALDLKKVTCLMMIMVVVVIMMLNYNVCLLTKNCIGYLKMQIADFTLQMMECMLGTNTDFIDQFKTADIKPFNLRQFNIRIHYLNV